MTEPYLAIPSWPCSKCGHTNFPYGQHLFAFPINGEKDVVCENCGNIDEGVEWLDPETKALIKRKERGLLRTESDLTAIEGKISVLEESRNADRKELQLLRQLVDDLIQNKIEKIRGDAAERNTDLATLTARVKELEDWRKFVKDMQ